MDMSVCIFDGVDGGCGVCVLNAWLKREEKRKVTFRMGENETEIDFVLIKKEHRRSMRSVKAISGEF